METCVPLGLAPKCREQSQIAPFLVAVLRTRSLPLLDQLGIRIPFQEQTIIHIMSASTIRVTARLVRTKATGACSRGWRHGTQTSFSPMATMVSQHRALSTSSSTKHSHHDQSKQNTGSGSDSIYTVNKDEIAKFAAMSDEWWAPQGPFKMLHLMNPPRIRYIRNRLQASGAISSSSASTADTNSRARFPLQGLRILDVGCGGGLLAEVIPRSYSSRRIFSLGRGS